jgi:zinc and cadmium transporter
MDPKFLAIVAATVINSSLGLAGAATLWFRENIFQRTVKILVAFSAGALLGAAFFHLLGEATGKIEPTWLYSYVLLGFMVFFVLEEYLHWHLCEECDIHPYSYLMVIGDSLHNIIDGLVIAGTFMTGIPLGIVTTLVILSHELPQELGVFAVIVSGGIEKKTALLYTFFSQTTCVLGGIVGYFAFQHAEKLQLFILPFAAGGFIYIAAADLIPSMHHSEGFAKITSFFWLVFGMAFMLAIKVFFGG